MRPGSPSTTSSEAPRALCAADYAAAARGKLPAASFTHVAGGAGDEGAARANRAAFARWAVLPRVLRRATEGHTRRPLAGHALVHPFILAPVASQKVLHAEGELETARAAAATDTPMVVSTLADQPLGDIAREARHAWFQLYWQPRADDTRALVRLAEESGCRALVVTVDAPVQPQGLASLREGFRLPAACRAVNVPRAVEHPIVVGEGESRIFQGAMRDVPGWDDIDALRRDTRLPVWLKGILHPGDAREAKQRGFAGVVVSNHGGRVLEAAAASLDVLPEVRDAVGPGFPVLFDGGIRSGSDAFKALALGADAVLVGRLQAYALAAAGALGVAHMIRLLREELELCMALAGCPTLDAITRDAVRRC